MDERLMKFLQEKCIFIKESNRQDQNIYTYPNSFISFQVDKKIYVTYEKEALLLLTLHGLKEYSKKKQLSKEEKAKLALKRWEKLEEDKGLQELVKSIQPSSKDIQKKKEYNRNKQKI